MQPGTQSILLVIALFPEALESRLRGNDVDLRGNDVFWSQSFTARSGGSGGGLLPQSRSRSFRLTLARVAAVTFFTITAQYRLWLPSLEGRLPLTTTEPAGTRP